MHYHKMLPGCCEHIRALRILPLLDIIAHLAVHASKALPPDSHKVWHVDSPPLLERLQRPLVEDVPSFRHGGP